MNSDIWGKVFMVRERLAGSRNDGLGHPVRGMLFAYATILGFMGVLALVTVFAWLITG